MSEARKIPEIIIKGIQKSIEISKKCLSENRKISPKVGVVLIKDNHIIETAYRGEIEQGEHAEYTLIERKLKGYNFENSILITTLEPCTIRSTPKKGCAQRIVEAGIKEVWIGINDPNPEISEKGYFYLMRHNINVHYFPADLAYQIKEINIEFWNNELDKYKHDLMSFPKSLDLSVAKTYSTEIIEDYIENYVKIDDFIWCLGEKLPLIQDYNLFNISIKEGYEKVMIYSYPYDLIYGDFDSKLKFDLNTFINGLDELDKRIILLKGPSGIGKSQLLKFLRYKLSIRFQERKSMIPIFIDLNYFDLKKSVYDLCKQQIQSITQLTDEAFKFLMNENYFIILMDAYNELKTEAQILFKKDLKNLMELYPQIKVFVSTTPYTIFDIPVNRSDILTLWMNPVIPDKLKSYYNSQGLSMDFYEFINQLKIKDLLEFVKILLFFNYVIIFLKKNDKLPDTRYEIINDLIKNYFNEFLGKKFKTIKFKESEVIFQDLLISLSYHMHIELESNKIKTSSLKLFFSDKIQNLKSSFKLPNEVKIDDFINFFLSFNVLKIEGENIMFFHDILFEYHCALKLAEEINRNNKLFKKKNFFHKKMLEETIYIAFPLISNKKFLKNCRKLNYFMYINGILQSEELRNDEIEYIKNFLLKKIDSKFFYIQKLAIRLVSVLIKYLTEKEDFLIKILDKEHIRKYHAELILELGRINTEKAKKYLINLNGSPDIHRYRVISLCTFNDDAIQDLVLNDLKEQWHGSEYVRWATEGFLILEKNNNLSNKSKNEILNLFLNPPKKLKFNFKNYSYYEDEYSIYYSYRNGLKKFFIQMKDPKIVPDLIKSIDYDRIDSFPIIDIVSKICSETHFNKFLDIIENDKINYKKRNVFVQIISKSSYKIPQDHILDLIQNIPSKFSDKNEDLFYMDLIELLLHKERIKDYNEDNIINILSKVLDRVGISQKALIKVIGMINPKYLFEGNPIKTINYYAFETLLEIIKDNKFLDLKDWLITHAKRCIPNWMKGVNSGFHNWYLFFKILDVLLEIDYYEEVLSLFGEILEKINNWSNINHISLQIINKFKDNDKMSFIKKISEGFSLLPKDKPNYDMSLFLEDIIPFKSEEFLEFNLDILRANAKSDYLIAEAAINNLINVNVNENRDEILYIFKKGIHDQLMNSFFKLISIALPEKSLKFLKPYLKEENDLVRNAAFREIQLIYEKQNILWYNGEEK